MSEYKQELCYQAHRRVLEALDVLSKIDFNTHYIDEIWLENNMIGDISRMLQSLSDNLYFKSKQFEKEAQDGQ